jgi:hypothetical protein
MQESEHQGKQICMAGLAQPYFISPARDFALGTLVPRIGIRALRPAALRLQTPVFIPIVLRQGRTSGC